MGLGFIVILGLVTFLAIEGRHLEAIATFSIGSVFAWFALGAGKEG